jgi:hypothetical protein
MRFTEKQPFFTEQKIILMIKWSRAYENQPLAV